MKQLEIEYHYKNYLEFADEDRFDVALLIYSDFFPLSPKKRSQLLQNIQSAVKPCGYFVLGVTTPSHRWNHGSTNGWYLAETSFWKQGPHRVLEDGFEYPDESICLDQAIVIEEDGTISV